MPLRSLFKSVSVNYLLRPVWIYGAVVLNHRVVLYAIDATPARWRGDAGSSPRAPDALLDFHTGCDGYKTRDKPKYRSGQVTEEGGLAYEEFLTRLKKLNLGEIARCQERQGFGFALKNALTRVRTPYVIVVQHDRNFVREAPIVQIVKCLEKNDAWLKYVLLPTTTVLNYPRYVQSKYQLRIAPQPTDFGFSLTPLLQWYDSTHICSMRHYRDFVYRGGLVARGGFVEDKLGQYQLKRIKERGLSAHAEFAQYVLDDGIEKPMVSHLDGHDSRVLEKMRFV